jgi:hypothetical protein
MSNNTREAVVAGQFYPGTAAAIEQSIQNYLDKVDQKQFAIKKLYGIISPHAGYPYSGEIAAYGYDIIKKEKPDKIIVIAPSHREFLKGFSIYPGEFYATPLGKIPLDNELADKIVEQTASVEKNMAGHKEEHSLEVQLPFLQYTLDDFEIVPIVSGNVDQVAVSGLAKSLSELQKEEEFVVVASSDLSHFHSYDEAVKKDRELIDHLKKFATENLVRAHKDRTLEACGMIPISVLLEYAQKTGEPEFIELDYRNSGDTAGGKGRVVGYLSAAIYE